MDAVLENGIASAMKAEIGGGVFGTQVSALSPVCTTFIWQAEAAKMPSGAVEPLCVNAIFAKLYRRFAVPIWPSDAILGGGGMAELM